MAGKERRAGMTLISSEQADSEGAIREAVRNAEIVVLRGDHPPGGGGPEGGGQDKKECGPCPVKPLGHIAGTFFYTSPSGQLRAISDSDHTQNKITGLFEDNIDWLWSRWPRTNKEGDTVGWNKNAATEYLIKSASKQGFFDPDTMMRGPGVWASEDGRLIVHAGDKLLVPADIAGASKGIRRGSYKEVVAGVRIENILYPTRRSETAPDLEETAEAKDAQDLLEFLGRWGWRDQQAGPRLWLGFAASAMVGGALRWRPHIHIAGDMGTGKSGLEQLLAGLFGAGAVERAADPSAPGIRQLLNGAARPVLLDEVEPGPNNMRAAQVMELARLASTDGQGAVVRGGSDGRPQRWFIRASFYFTSILHPKPLPQDRSRITFLDLNPLPRKSADDSTGHVQGLRRFAKIGPKLRGRLIQRWDTLQANLHVFSSALARSEHTRRQCDQLATLLACAETLLHDDPIEATVAEDLLDSLGLNHVEQIEHDHDECLNHLLSSQPDIFRSGRRRTIGELLHDARTPEGTEERKALRSMGMAVDPFLDRWERLIIANQHQGLEAIFANTRWAGGVWNQSLQRFPDATLSGKVVSFAGAKSRAVLLPRTVFGDLSGTGSGGGLE
jgi:hypothetical protein